MKIRLKWTHDYLEFEAIVELNAADSKAYLGLVAEVEAEDLDDWEAVDDFLWEKAKHQIIQGYLKDPVCAYVERDILADAAGDD